MDATTIGVDLAKSVFEVAVADRHWRLVSRHRFTRTQFERFLRSSPPTHVVMEACGTSHFWARVAEAQGHRVSLLPAQYVRPYVRRNKTDRTDAEALLEAVRSGRIAPVTVKTVLQQELLALHRIRDQWMATRTARINALRGFLREHGCTLARGARTILARVTFLLDDASAPIPERLRHVLPLLIEEIRDIEDRIETIERALAAVAKEDAVVQRLMQIPGVGLLTATALVATVGHIHAFRTARRFASWLGLTPRERSSGGHRRLGAISKQGDVYPVFVDPRGPFGPPRSASRREARKVPVAITAMGARRPGAPRPQQSHGRPREQARTNHLGRLEPRCGISRRAGGAGGRVTASCHGRLRGPRS